MLNDVNFFNLKNEINIKNHVIKNHFKTALHLRDWHLFIWQALKNLNIFNNSTLKQVF